MITTNIFDSARGVPAARVPVELDFFVNGEGWKSVSHAESDSEGQVGSFGLKTPAAGIYRLMYDVGAYMPDSFFPSISVTFEIRDIDCRYHIPIVLSQFGYSTYRESWPA
jgi:5-hydroxyisourate hydrolase